MQRSGIIVLIGAVVVACGFQVAGGTSSSSSSSPPTEPTSNGDANSVSRDGAGETSEGSSGNDSGNGNASPLDASLQADVKLDVDASCKQNGLVCGAASECCGLQCEDENGTKRCQ